MGDTFLGRYVSAGLLGQGSMGRAWLAHPIGQPDRNVVVKVMLPVVASQPRFRQLFEREIESMRRLRHPHVVQLLDSGIDGAHGPCLVMEHVAGVTLEALLAKVGKLAVGHVGLLLGYLCRALEAAHALGIVHRDLKPANLMIVGAGTLDESLRVMDFGLAQFSSKPHFTQERLAGAGHTSAHGTPSYICPEQLRGDEVDPRSDLYSVGVILYEMLTGQLPFLHTDVGRILRAHIDEKPLSFALVGVRDLSPAVERIVQLCLSKFSVERPASARELAQLFSSTIGIDIWEAAQPESGPEVLEAAPKRSAPIAERNAIVHRLEAWMPERIAVVKLRGFLEDIGGKVAETEPGLLRIRLGEPENPEQGRKNFRGGPLREMPIEIELQMEKPDPRGTQLDITVIFRPFSDPILALHPDWRNRCDKLYKDLQSYLMATR